MLPAPAEQVLSDDGRKIQLIHLTRAMMHKILWSDKTKIDLSCVYSVMVRGTQAGLFTGLQPSQDS